MKTISDFIVRKRALVLAATTVLVVVCALFIPRVETNADMTKYLPDSSPMKQGMALMEEEFPDSATTQTIRVMFDGLTPAQNEEVKGKLEAIPHVDSVDYQPDSPDHNKDGHSLFVLGTPCEYGTPEELSIEEALDTGFSSYDMQWMTDNPEFEELPAWAIPLALAILLVVLLAMSSSWIEPFLFLASTGFAVIANMGTNIVFGQVSFITFSVSPILQLAVSMDYSIFLLHTFTALKNRGMEIHEAMVEAIRESCSSILASGATTIVGFIVIAFMRFTIGKDVGFVLAKGIICSLLTVLLLMPTLILRFDDKIVKTAHKPLIASFDGFARAMYKIRVPVFLLAALLAVPCYFGQSMNKFLYGDDAIGAGPGTRVYEDTQEINSLFKKSNMTICIVPNGSSVTEKELAKELENLDFVNYVISMSGTMPNGIPESFLPEDLTSQLRNEDYARMLISMDTLQESDYAFECSARLEEVVHKYYPDHSYVIGMTPTTIDIRDILTEDYNNVSLLSLAGVALVVFITFRSILVPILVIVPIEVAIYLNMTLPYVMGDSMIYIGYIIVSCLQLGATIDYSILMTNNYLAFRKEKGRREAAVAAVNKSTLSIMTSGGILMVVGYLLYFTSSIQAISQVGRLVGRGAFLSVTLVLSLLPALLSAFDKQIKRQQEKADARKERRRKRLAAAKNLTGARNVASEESAAPEKNLTPAERPASATGKSSPEENITPAQTGESDQKEKGDDSHEEE